MKNMTLYFHGTNPGHPYNELPAISLEYGSGKIRERSHIMMDVGSYDFEKFSSEKVDAIFLSHLHPDHINKLNLLLWDITLNHMLYEGGWREKLSEKKLPIFSPEYFDFTTGPPHAISPDVVESFAYEVTAEIPDRFGPFEVKHIATEHFSNKKKVPSFGYKFSLNNKSIGYTGDTRYFQNLSNFFKGVDVLICEATLGDEMEDIAEKSDHMIPKSVTKLANEAKPEKLILTHFGFLEREEFANKVREKYEGEVLVAYPGIEIEI